MTGETILSRSNDPVPVETRLQIVLAVMSGELRIWQKGSVTAD